MVQKFELMSSLIFSFYIKVGIWHRPNWSVGNSWLFCVYRPMVQKFELMELNSPPLINTLAFLVPSYVGLLNFQ